MLLERWKSLVYQHFDVSLVRHMHPAGWLNYIEFVFKLIPRSIILTCESECRQVKVPRTFRMEWRNVIMAKVLLMLLVQQVHSSQLSNQCLSTLLQDIVQWFQCDVVFQNGHLIWSRIPIILKKSICCDLEPRFHPQQPCCVTWTRSTYVDGSKQVKEYFAIYWSKFLVPSSTNTMLESSWLNPSCCRWLDSSICILISWGCCGMVFWK